MNIYFNKVWLVNINKRPNKLEPAIIKALPSTKFMYLSIFTIGLSHMKVPWEGNNAFYNYKGTIKAF